ncbi:Hsp20/alpha crystallin family protein [Psychromonas sp. PT13]|uniref:Hsp20/alpha crystallin family protein n=1 Tax=Psychromonas sp. PT13 TaxID=3439547 RepID=UPI003EB75781
MNIVPRDPWFNMDNFFDDLFLHNNQAEQEGFFKPRVDIFDKGDHYLFIAELPGVAKKDINVSTRNGVLTIEAKVSEEHSAEKDQTIRKERREGFYTRSLNIGENIDADAIKAEFTDGLLKLTAPKPEKPAEETHKIAIH